MKIINFKYFTSLLTFLSFFIQVNAQLKEGGLALYTVRNEMEKDPRKTLNFISNIGYKAIESSGYQNGKFYGMTPIEFRLHLTSLGLHPLSAHQSSITIENAKKMMQDVKEAGFEYFVIPIPPMGMFKVDEKTMNMEMQGGNEVLAALLNYFGKMAYDMDLKLLYHNHDFEFIADETGTATIDYLLTHCDPRYVNFQMDLYWVTKAHADPLTYFEKYPGRFKSWHVKDMDIEGKFAPVGQGTIDFAKILKAKEKSGMVYFMVEQDECYGISPLEAIEMSYNGIQTMGFK